MLTTEFPFLCGEPFLEREIFYVAQRFDEVLIFATVPDGQAKSTRATPENVRAFPIHVYRNYACIALFSGLFAKKEKYHGLRQSLYGAYCEGMARGIAKRVKKRLIPLLSSDDCIVVYSYWFNYLCAAACRTARALRDHGIQAEVISRSHRHDLYAERKKTGVIPLQKENLRTVDGVYACSENGRDYLKGKYPGDKNRIHTAYLGVENGDVCASLSAKRFLTASPLRAVKRLELFAEAFALFHQRHPEWKWVMLGGVPSDSPEVEKIVRENKLEDAIVAGGYLSNKELLRFYRESPVSYLVNTSSSEGLPVSMMEAQSFGVPCIGPDVGGVGEIIDEENGFLFPKDVSVKSLADLLERAANLSEEEYKAKSQKSFARQRERFDADKNFTSWADMLYGLTNVNAEGLRQ